VHIQHIIGESVGELPWATWTKGCWEKGTEKFQKPYVRDFSETLMSLRPEGFASQVRVLKTPLPHRGVFPLLL